MRGEAGEDSCRLPCCESTHLHYSLGEGIDLHLVVAASVSRQRVLEIAKIL